MLPANGCRRYQHQKKPYVRQLIAIAVFAGFLAAWTCLFGDDKDIPITVHILPWVVLSFVSSAARDNRRRLLDHHEDCHECVAAHRKWLEKP